MAAPIVACPNCGRRNRIRSQKEGVPRCAVCGTALPWIVDAGAEIFDAEVEASVPVLVDFWAPWCGPCRMVSPAVEKVAHEHAGRLKVVKLDIDDAPAVAARHGVQGVPLLIVLEDGREVDRLMGAAPERELRRWVEPHLPAAVAP